jgi:prepilin-type N-terminal cleavage/methylation domain-containing protein/prepilin-type processing-associated H-X9-DG protein
MPLPVGDARQTRADVKRRLLVTSLRVVPSQPNRPHPTQTVRGFTLIEVLVVVAVIALLVAILLPALGRARAQSRLAVCASHERQMGVAATIFTVENKSRIPRGLSRNSAAEAAGSINWIRMIAKLFGERGNYAANFNRVPVEKHEVFSCPERAREYGGIFLDYAINSTDSRGPMTLNPCRANPASGQFFEVEGVTKVDLWKRASEVVYIMDAVQEGWNVVDAGRSLKGVRTNIAAVRADPYPMKTGFDWFDLPGGWALPTHRNFLTTPLYPRGASLMHLGIGSNAVYVDGHVDLVKPPPESAGLQKVYQFYLKKLGVDPDVVRLVGGPAAPTAAVDPCVQGDIKWRP